MKVVYVGVAVLVYIAAAIAMHGVFRWHDWHFAILAAISVTGIIPFTLAAVRSLRGLPVDDRMISTWAWLSTGISALLRFTEKKGLVELGIAILFVGTGIVSLIQFIRNPKPPPPEPEKGPVPIPSELKARDGPSEPIGCAFALGFLLLMMAPISQFFIRPRSLFMMGALAAVGLTLMLGGSLFGRKKGS